MAKKPKGKKVEKKVDKKNVDYNSTTQTSNIGDYNVERMKIYGANNNIMRHIPSADDGLKICERRILYTMYNDLKLSYNTPFLKVASIAGRVIKYHPHSESSSTLVRLAQNWNNLQCLIEGSGNFGAPNGDAGGDGRYIEARLSYYAYKCFFEEYDNLYVLTKNIYSSNDEVEPICLPARYPHALFASGGSDVGYAVATTMCPYNFKEILELTIKMMKNPKQKGVELIPDSPTGAYILNEGQFGEITNTGSGTFKMRGVIDIDFDENAIHIKSTPHQAFWVNIKQDVLKILQDGKTELMRNMTDESTIDNIHYVIYLKKEVDPVSVVEKIYKKTQMEKTFSINLNYVKNFEIVNYSVLELIENWIDFRRATKRRVFNHLYTNKRSRQHILEILLFILNKDNAEATVTLIKNSNNKAEIVEKLQKKYGISSLQAETIAGMRMVAFSKDAYKSYVKEKEEVDKLVKKYEKIIRSPHKIDEIIIDELKEGIELFGEDRRSRIISPDNTVKVRNTSHIVVFTRKGYVKKLPDTVKNIGFIEQGDYPVEVIKCENYEELLVFDETGKVFKLPVMDILGSSLTSPGGSIRTHCKINGSVVCVKIKPEKKALAVNKIKPMYVVTVTKNGIIKKSSIANYASVKSELVATVIKDNDKLVSVKVIPGDMDIVIYTREGNGIRFNTSEVKETGRQSIGVKAITLSDNDEVVGMETISKNRNYLFMTTARGYCKKSTLDNFKTMTRGDDPLKLISMDNDILVSVKTVIGNEKYNVYLKTSTVVVDIEEDVVEVGRLSKGRKLIPVRKGDFIIDVVKKTKIL